MLRDIVRRCRRHEIAGEALCLYSGIGTRAHGLIERLKIGRLRPPGERINKGLKGDYQEIYQEIKADIFKAPGNQQMNCFQTGLLLKKHVCRSEN
jgi:hypothetical protein